MTMCILILNLPAGGYEFKIKTICHDYISNRIQICMLEMLQLVDTDCVPDSRKAHAVVELGVQFLYRRYNYVHVHFMPIGCLIF